MSETQSVGELESIAQAIALADGFQLLVLECESLPPGGLDLLLDEVQPRVAALRGEPLSIVMVHSPDYFVHTIVDGPGALIFQGTEATVIDGTATDGIVFDGTGMTVVPFDWVRRESSWRFLFQRLNERRNGVIRNHPRTLILALTPALSRMFFEEAPDMASIRSGMFHIDATMLGAKPLSATAPVTRTAGQQPNDRDDAPPRELSANDRLQELLLDLFETNELYRFVGYNFPEVTLPDNVSPSDLALAVVHQLGKLGRIDRSLFERLARVRPDHRDEIDDVARLWGYKVMSATERGADSSVSFDLHERLLALTPSQQEAVIYLAGFAGDDSANTTRSLRKRPPTSTRELLGRAQSEGPEALARLADAIDLVTARE